MRKDRAGGYEFGFPLIYLVSVFYGRGGGYGRCVADVGLSGALLGLVMVFGAAVIGEEKKIKLLVLTAMMVGTVGLICSRVIVFEREGFGGI